MMKSVKKGQEIWFSTPFYTGVNSGIVTTACTGLSKGFIHIKRTRNSVDMATVSLNDCYSTQEELVAAIEAKAEARIKDGCEYISSVNDLVEFIYRKMISYATEADKLSTLSYGRASDAVDWNDIRMISIRAKELLGLELPCEK